MWDIRNLFENEKEHYYKPVRVSIFSGNSYIEYESKSDSKKLLVKKSWKISS